MRILKNSLANLGAAVLPALATLLTLPFIVAELGVDNYGILTMVMAITGYFSIADINVTAGSTKYIAEHQAKGEMDRTSEVISFGLAFYLIFGLLGALVIACAASSIVGLLFKLTEEGTNVAVDALRLSALGFFLGQSQTYLNSVIQALHRYDVTASCEAVFGTLIPVATLLLLYAGFDLLSVITLRVAVSAIHGIALVVAIRRLLPHFQFRRPERELSVKLWSFSSYSFMSRIASVTHQQADKLIIGGILGMTALTYYAVASQIVGRIVSFSFRLANAIYPAASAMDARGESEKLTEMYFISSRYITYINGCAVLIVCVFGRELLHYWMGSDFASYGYLVLVFVAIALLFDSLTTIPSLVNDALGKPRNTGLFALMRTIFATFLVWLFASQGGSIGIAALGQVIAAIVAVISFLYYIHASALPWTLGRLARFAYLRPLPIFLLVVIAIETLRGNSILPPHEALVSFLVASVFLISSGWLFIVQKSHRDDFLALLGVRRNDKDK